MRPRLRAATLGPGVIPGTWSASPHPLGLLRSVAAACARGVDDGAEEGAGSRVVAREILGMPLHGHHEAPAIGVLECLDDLVGCPADLLQVAAEAVHGLVVEAVHAQLRGSENRPDPRVLDLYF